MKEKLPYWASVIFSAIALVLMVVNFSLASTNRAAQLDVAQRQSTISGGQAINQVNQGLVQAMAEAAFKNNNMQLRDLLASQGITLRNDQSSSAPAASAPVAKPAEKK